MIFDQHQYKPYMVKLANQRNPLYADFFIYNKLQHQNS